MSFVRDLVSSVLSAFWLFRTPRHSSSNAAALRSNEETALVPSSSSGEPIEAKNSVRFSVAAQQRDAMASRPPIPSLEQDGGVIRAVLEDDYLLPKILGYLVEDGLQDCRCVCRRWRYLCSTLAVRLTFSSKDDIHEVPKLFPNVADLTSSSCLEHVLMYEPGHKMDPEGRYFSNSLIQLTNLRRLSIEDGKARRSRLKEIEASLLALGNLQSLSVDSIRDDCFETFFVAMKVLTKLTTLRLTSVLMHRHVRTDPVTEIQKLKQLELSAQLLVNDKDQLLFPCLSQLTHLGIGCLRSPEVLTKASDAWALSLRSVKIFRCITVVISKAWSALLEFPFLESVVFDKLGGKIGYLQSVIGQLTQLQHLSMDAVRDHPGATAEMLSAMGNLRSLCCREKYMHYIPGRQDDNPCSVAHLTQLTGLTLLLQSRDVPCVSLTGIVELDIETHMHTDLSDTVSTMQLLEFLRLKRHGGCCLRRPSVLRNLMRLKSVSLDCLNDISGDFFPTLATLPDLTYLMFNSEKEERSLSSLSQISLLTNLIELDVSQIEITRPLRVIRQSILPKLRSIKIRRQYYPKRTEKEVRKRLPRLNRITL